MEISKTLNLNIDSCRVVVVADTARFAAANSLKEYVSALMEGRNLVTTQELSLKSDRFFNSGLYTGGFLDDIGLFDNGYFHIKPEEAREIDPATRAVLLEIPKLSAQIGGVGKLAGKSVGVFMGARAANYSDKFEAYSRYSVCSLGQNFISAYPSQVFDFKGPALVVDTACSSSLVALHMATQSLKNKECDAAIVGGVELLIDQKPFDLLGAARVLSNLGRCAPFSADADGIVLGEGIGLVLLKRLKDAIKDHDEVLAVILGSAVNNDGSTMGISTPNPEMQSNVITKALDNAGISPDDIEYVEAHATGTPVGDPMELLSIANNYGKNNRCLVGSVKGNIGHTLCAAGIANFIKVIEMFRYDMIFKSINCLNINKRFNFDDSKLEIARENIAWQYKDDQRRFAGISAFGFGGTNAHVIVSDYKRSPSQTIVDDIKYNLSLNWIGETSPIDVSVKTVQQKYNNSFEISGDKELAYSHLVNSRAVLPGVTYLSFIESIIKYPLKLNNVVFSNQLSIGANEKKKVFMHQENKRIFIESTTENGDITEHCSCELSEYRDQSNCYYDIDIEELKSTCDRYIGFDNLYGYASSVGIKHDNFFRNRGGAFIKNKMVLLEIINDNTDENFYFRYDISPAILDGATFAFVALHFDEFKNIRSTFIPLSIDKVIIHRGSTDKRLYAIIDNDKTVVNSSSEIYKHDLTIIDEEKNVIAQFIGIMGKKIVEHSDCDSSDFSSSPTFDDVDAENLDELSFISHVIYDVTEIDIRKFGIDARFLDTGVSSNNLIAIVQKMEDLLGVQLYPVLLFEYDTPRKLSEYIANLDKDIRTVILGSLESGCKRIPINFDVQKGKPINYIASHNPHDIAIISFFGEFGPYSNHREFWKGICSFEEAIEQIPEERLELWRTTLSSSDDKFYGSWVKNIDKFDCDAYGILPKDAELMDPQERKLLDAVRRCVEEAGYDPATLSLAADSKVGVFSCSMFEHYELWGCTDSYDHKVAGKSLPNSMLSNLANRISYIMNWQGASIALDTMCSSALTAVHLAKEALLRGEINVAVVGAVNLTTHPQKYFWLKENGFLSPDGTCPSYGMHADGTDGYTPGEGVGCIILKRLDDAVKDHDAIVGIVTGSAVNHGGRAPGYTVPCMKSQEDVIRSAIQDANVHVDEISYVEGHGTGTVLGDPIEIKALSNVFADKIGQLRVGALKANIGHLEAASGIASIIKVLMQMSHRNLAPTLIKELNSNIDLGTNIKLQKSPEEWNKKRLIAGISAFGAGGSNAHIILKDFESLPQDVCNDRYILCFSARSLLDLQDYILDIKTYLNDKTGFLRSLSYILTTQRAHCKYRISRIVSSEAECKDFLTQLCNSFSNKDWFAALDSCSGIVQGKSHKTPNIQSLRDDLISYFEGESKDSTVFERFQKLYLSGATLPEHILVRSVQKITCPSCPYVHSANSFWCGGSHNMHYFKLNNGKSTTFIDRAKSARMIVPDNIGLEPTSLPTEVHMTGDFIFQTGDVLCLILKVADSLEEIHKTIRHHVLKISDKKHVELVVITDNIAVFSLLKSICEKYIDFTVIHTRDVNTATVQSILSKVAVGYPESRLIQYDNGKFTDYIFSAVSKKDIGSMRKTKEHKHYLIIGGLGTVGYSCCRYLAQNANISIIGRSELSPQNQEKLHHFSNASYFRGDVLDSEKLKSVIDQAVQQNGELSGVVYAAGGNYEDFLIKTRGLKNLLQAITSSTPVYCISSYSSVLGFEKSEYAFVNGWINDVTMNDSRVTALLFPYIIGTATNYDVKEYCKWLDIHYGVRAFSEHDVMQSLKFALDNQTNGAYFCTSGNYAKIEKTVSNLFARAKYIDVHDNTSLKASENPLSQCKNDVLSEMRDIIRNVSGLQKEEFDSYSWSELGFSSIDMKNLVTEINNKFGIGINVNKLFEYTSPGTLSNYISSLAPCVSVPESSDSIIETCDDDPIVIVNMDCLLPKSNDIASYEQNLVSCKNLFSPVPSNRWNDTSGVVGGFVDLSVFDYSFFNYIPDEVKYLDPQQKVFLGLCSRLLQKSGLNNKRIDQYNVGVFVGAQFNDYYQIVRHDDTVSPFKTVGNSLNFVANRVSYYFGFNGPSEVFDTACSSGMTAFKHACSSIRDNECDIAIAGAVSLMFDKQTFYDACNLGVISPSGICNVFDESADGYVRSEGAGCLLIMRKSIADKLRLPPLATVKGISINHSGRAASLTAPKLDAEISLLTSTYERLGINSEAVRLIEAHGTGTHIGDSVEVEAIMRSFEGMLGKEYLRRSNKTCFISSSKARVGHTEPVSGIVGIITAILSLKNNTIFGNNKLRNLNSNINLSYDFFKIPSENVSWSSVEKRIVGISSFGFGGTNLHCVLEEC